MSHCRWLDAYRPRHERPGEKMKFKYCPNCAGISTMQAHEGLFKCSRCNYFGKPEEGTADQINALSKRIKAGMNPLNAAQTAAPAPEKPDASSMDSIKESALKPNSDKKKIDFVADPRLKSLKGKKTGDFEFL